MNPFFSTPARIAALDAEARSWLGTPFVPHAMVKGAGTDCVHLVAGIYVACGALFRPDVAGLPAYALNEGSHLRESRIENWFASRPDFCEVPASGLQPGDALVLNMARVGHHLGLFLGQMEFIHALPQREVTISSLAESFYQRRISVCFRPIICSGGLRPSGRRS